MKFNLITFGFKYGFPPEADLLLDVRFLANPYFVNELRKFDGRDPRIIQYIFGYKKTKKFLTKFKNLLNLILLLYKEKSRNQLTVAIGCTGGKHRSVTVVEWLSKELIKQPYFLVIQHRDIYLDII